MVRLEDGMFQQDRSVPSGNDVLRVGRCLYGCFGATHAPSCKVDFKGGLVQYSLLPIAGMVTAAMSAGGETCRRIIKVQGVLAACGDCLMQHATATCLGETYFVYLGTGRHDASFARLGGQ